MRNKSRVAGTEWALRELADGFIGRGERAHFNHNARIVLDAIANDAAAQMRDKCVERLKARRDKFQQAADSSSLPNDLTASRDAAVAAALTGLLGELKSLTLDTEKAQ